MSTPILQFERPAQGRTNRVAAPDRWTETVLMFGSHRMPIVVGARDDRVVGLRFGLPEEHRAWLDTARRDDDSLTEVRRQLAAYAAGELTSFTVPLLLTGTDFQLAVWRALTEIPFGETSTYGRVAAAVGRPAGSRAVGAAVGSNPIGIIVPCHRVIGANGSLTGFGGGLDNKVALLAREGAGALPAPGLTDHA